MADRKTFSALTKTPVTIPPYSVSTLDFIDSKPNYFRVQNSGASIIYCGTSGYPTPNDYDFLVRPSGLMSYAEPFKQTKLYLFNPSGEAVNCMVVSFYAEFDPLLLALGQIEVQIPETIAAASVISGFEASLPSGNNKIGKVDVANQKDYTTALSEIKASISKIENQGVKFAVCKSGTATSSGTLYAATAKICEIGFFSNDGSGDITLTFTETDGTENSIVIKSGEVLNNIPCTLASIKVAGDNVAYRLLYCERND